MAGSDRRVTFLISANIKNFTKGLDKAQKKFRRFGRDLKRTGRDLTQNVTAPLGILGGLAVKTAADFESLQQSMNILNGSVEEGARNFERLKRFSAETPFQLKDLAEAQNMLQGFSLTADQAFESMSMIGDIAAVTGGDIKGIGIAFGQAAAEGRLMTRDIRQLINQGVPAIQLLADTMGVATSEVLDLASEGKITFDILVQAFKDATSEGGMFADGMEKQAQTLAGIWSTLKDNVNIALGELGDTIVETFDLKQVAKDLIESLKVIVTRFQEMSKESKKQILKVAGLFMAGGPLLFALGQAAVAISAFVKFVRTRFFLITAAVAGTIGVIKQWRQVWNNVFGDGSQEIDNIFTATKKGMQEVMGVVMDFTEEALGMNGALGEFRDLLSDLDKRNPDDVLDGIVSSAKSNKNVFKDLSSGASGGGQAANPFLGAANPINSANSAMVSLGSTLDVSVGKLQKASSKFDTIKEAMKGAKEQAKVMGQALQSSVTSAVTGFAETLGNAFTGDAGAEGFFNNLLLIVVDFANQFGKLLIAAGVAAQAFQSLLANPIGAIIAGGALVAATTAVKNLLQKGPQQEGQAQGMAQGGVVPSGFPNDTYPAMLSSGETVIPSPKPLPSGMGGGVIHNVIQLDGKTVYDNQKEVNRKINR